MPAPRGREQARGAPARLWRCFGRAIEKALRKRPLIAIVGPTGSGKSALALHLARCWGGDIINCDSLQLYRYFDIGSAKPLPEQRRLVPHHLIDILDPDQLYSAGDYARDARRTLEEITARNRLPILAGGTGFYLRALLDGLFEGPQRDDALRAALAAREQRRKGVLHRILRRLDPATAARIHPHDVQKLIRALEIRLRAGRPLSELFAQGTRPLEQYQCCQIGLDPPRAALFAALDRRCLQMFQLGLLEEVRAIIARGYGPQCKPFEAIGYKHALRILQGECSFEQGLGEMQKETRHYAKRQWTWFRKDRRVIWIAGFGKEAETIARVEETIMNFFAGSIRLGA